ncbi:MAG: hypothetical protein ACK5B9_09135 [Flavobacteriia bacterium]
MSKFKLLLFIFLTFHFKTAIFFGQVSEGNVEQMKVIKILTVTENSGTHFRELPNENSPILGVIEYNEKVNVIEEHEDWFGISVLLQRSVMENGAFDMKTKWEKVYVTKNSFASQLNLKLKKEDLNKISRFSYKEKDSYFSEIQAIDSLLKISFVEKVEFDTLKKNSLNYFVADTNRFEKYQGELVIVCKKKKILFRDNPVLNESSQMYHYLGQIPDLNVYVVGCWYWEDFEYKLIDKKTGIEVASLNEFPILSQDKQKLISIYGNIYNLTGDLSVYQYANKQLHSKFSLSFSEWMPSYELGDIFWGKDNCLYLAVINKNNYWKEDGNLNLDFQFIKIKFD